MKSYRLVLLAASAVASALPGFAQSASGRLLLDAAASPASTVSAVSVTTAPIPRYRADIDRWVDINDLSFSFRYRSEKNNDEFRYFDNGQQKSLVAGDFKFDPAGRYAVHFAVSSGRSFNWSYADEIGPDYVKVVAQPAASTSLTPAQLQSLESAIAADPAAYVKYLHQYSRGWEMYFRQLYFRAAPVKQLAAEYGSLAIEKGMSTEATTYDDDGYIDGERVRLFDPRHVFFDQVAITYAYEGDILVPNFFERGERLEHSNYHQFLAAKKFNSRLDTSVDYTFDKGTHTLRQAALVKAPEAKVIDSVRLELYQRLNDHVLNGGTYYAHQGFAVTGSKTFAGRFHLDGGFAHIDYDYGVLTGVRVLAAAGFSMNGDSYLLGSRAFTHGSLDVAPGVKLFGYYTHALGSYAPAVLIINHEGLNGGMTIDLKALIEKPLHAM